MNFGQICAPPGAAKAAAAARGRLQFRSGRRGRKEARRQSAGWPDPVQSSPGSSGSSSGHSLAHQGHVGKGATLAATKGGGGGGPGLSLNSDSVARQPGMVWWAGRKRAPFFLQDYKSKEGSLLPTSGEFRFLVHAHTHKKNHTQHASIQLTSSCLQKGM